MECQKITNLLDNTPNHSSKFKTKSYLERNDNSRGTYNTNSQTKLKNSMLKSSLCDCSDAYILVSGTIMVTNTPAASRPVNNNNIEVIFKNCAPFTDCLCEINNTQIDDAKDIHVEMLMYNLIGYSDNYSKTSGRSL